MKISFKMWRAAMFAALLVPASAAAQTTPTTPTAPKTAPKKADTKAPDQKLSDADVKVLSEVHAINAMEIELGKLAKGRAGSKPVKAYAVMMIKDHEAADREVMAIAKKHAATLTDHPTPKDAVEAEQMQKDMATMERLKTLEGTTFDREYLTTMIEGHTLALAKIDAAMGMVTNPQVKARLTKLRPVVQKHLDKAKALQTPGKQAMR